MNYLCWDIDGTLLRSAWAGYDALRDAIRDRYAIADYHFKHSLAGNTDSSIIREIVEEMKGLATKEEISGLMSAYEDYMKKYVPSHQGHLMPNVLETLTYLEQEAPEWRSCLLTGNTVTGSRLKVETYHIARFFDLARSATGDLAEDRADLARILYDRLLKDQLITSVRQMIFVGDTPNDVRCAAAIDARCIIVLSGSEFKQEDFAALPPWQFLPKLPDNPEEFLKLISRADNRPTRNCRRHLV